MAEPAPVITQPAGAWPVDSGTIVAGWSAMSQDRQEMTDRILRAIDNPHVDVLAHPTGRRLLKREPYPVDMEAIVAAAARNAPSGASDIARPRARTARPCASSDPMASSQRPSTSRKFRNRPDGSWTASSR